MKSSSTVQASSGDFEGARETSRALPDKSSVLEAIGIRQVDQGDLEDALRTAAQMKRSWSDGVLFGVATKLRERGDRQGAHKIPLLIADPDMVQTLEEARTDVSNAPTTLCDEAWEDAKAARYSEAYQKIPAAKCNCRLAASILQEAGDPEGAFQAMHACPSLADVSSGMAELATRSAKMGRIPDAPRFAESVHVSGASFEEGYLAPALREISREWAKSGDLASVLKWARSRPTAYERAMALLGAAESAPLE